MNNIHLIEQEKTECGLACVAMLAGETTEDVKKLIFPEKIFKKIKNIDQKSDVFYTHCRDLVNAFEKLEIRVAAVKFIPWRDLSGTYVVGVATDDPKHFHWIIVIKDKGLNGKFIIIDPECATVYYNGASWVDIKDGYIRRKNSNIIKVEIDIDGIDFSQITLAKNNEDKTTESKGTTEDA